ncbi:MAG: TetR/AcrR family transcriptional regulator [Flavobacteriales bacterium]|nr:TetR/AcrR family transcriptional regulator [Flavobacteriales bacterium]
MEKLLSNLGLKVSEYAYLKDPESSDLGKRITQGAIDLIDAIGFEEFTFRKLAQQISSTEASIYRYFENKHKLLLYLTSWYWSWMNYRLAFAMANVPDPKERLVRAIELLTRQVEEDGGFTHINEVKLHRIIIEDSSKVYLTREVDEENKEGAYLIYKELVGRVSEVIKEIAPDFKYPNMLVSTVIEGARHQHYFAEHLPRLTNVIEGEDAVTDFYREMVLHTIREESIQQA